MDRTGLPTSTIDTDSYSPPDLENMDLGQLQIIFDVDLDELTILFYGIDVPHSVHPLDGNLSDFGLLLELDTHRVVGVVSELFTERVVTTYPKLGLLLGIATIIDDDIVFESPSSDQLSPPRRGGVPSMQAALRALADRPVLTDRLNIRELLQNIPAFVA